MQDIGQLLSKRREVSEMSGGHFEYVGSLIQTNLAAIANDKIMKERFPILSELLQKLGNEIYRIEHCIDYDICGDTKLKESDVDVEKLFIGNLLEDCMKVAPDKWFPRGKWATIQAIQARIGNKK